jgi:hypothetical protein
MRFYAGPTLLVIYELGYLPLPARLRPRCSRSISALPQDLDRDLAESLEEHPPRHWFANVEQLAGGATVAYGRSAAAVVHGDLRL